MIVNMIPVFDLKRQNKELEREYIEIFQDVLRQGLFILGEKVEEFEKKFAEYIGVKYALGVASGTDALTLSLLALGIGEGDEVIMPANSYPSAFGLAATGAKLVLVDIDRKTYNIDPTKLERAINKKTKAIIPVHLYGNPAEMNQILAIARKWSIPVVEDCAQAVGAEINGKKVGSFGDIGCFSFYPTKNLGAFGDGGMVVTNDTRLYEKLRLLRMYGEKERYKSVLVGKNSRLDELQAAFLLVKLKYLDRWIERRREISENIKYQISNIKYQIILPFESSYSKHVYHLFVIRTKKRDELKEYLDRKGIQTAIHYPVPIHLVSSFKNLRYKKGDFPEAERASQEILSLPLYPEMTNKEVLQIAKSVVDFYD